MASFRPSGISIALRQDLSEGSSRTGTTLDIDPIITKDGHRVTMSDIGDICFAKISPGTDNEEIISFTGITDNTTYYTLTGVVWGYNFYNGTGDVDDNKKSQVAGNKIIITNDDHYLNEQYLSKDDFDPDDNTLELGDGTDTDKTIKADNGDASEPYLRYDASTNKWVFSNDGTSDNDIGGGAGAMSGGDGIDITASEVSVDLASGSKLTKTGGTGDQLDLDSDIDDALDGTSGTPSSSNKFVTADETKYYGSIKHLTLDAGETINGATTPVAVFIENQKYKEKLDEYNSQLTNGDYGRNIGTNGGQTQEAQTFTVGSESFYLTKIRLMLAKNNISTSTTLTVGLYATDGSNKPTGSALATTTMDASTLSTSKEWVELDFSSPYELSSSTKYSIVLKLPDGDNSHFVVWYYGSGSYAFESTDSGLTWSANSGEEFTYRLFGYHNENRTKGRVYTCDADDDNKTNFFGFAISNSTAGNAIDIQTAGIVNGFSGLTTSEKYYVQDDRTLGTSKGTYEIYVGIAVSTTEISIEKKDWEYLGNDEQLGSEFGSSQQLYNATITVPPEANYVIVSVNDNADTKQQLTLTRDNLTSQVINDNGGSEISVVWSENLITVSEDADIDIKGYFYR